MLLLVLSSALLFNCFQCNHCKLLCYTFVQTSNCTAGQIQFASRTNTFCLSATFHQYLKLCYTTLHSMWIISRHITAIYRSSLPQWQFTCKLQQFWICMTLVSYEITQRLQHFRTRNKSQLSCSQSQLLDPKSIFKNSAHV